MGNANPWIIQGNLMRSRSKIWKEKDFVNPVPDNLRARTKITSHFDAPIHAACGNIWGQTLIISFSFL